LEQIVWPFVTRVGKGLRSRNHAYKLAPNFSTAAGKVWRRRQPNFGPRARRKSDGSKADDYTVIDGLEKLFRVKCSMTVFMPYAFCFLNCPCMYARDHILTFVNTVSYEPLVGISPH